VVEYYFLEMSSKVKFLIYYVEEGHVEYGPNDVILQRFIIFPSILDNLEEQNFRFVYHWLAHTSTLGLAS
jgi:hypothetical protein